MNAPTLPLMSICITCILTLLTTQGFGESITFKQGYPNDLTEGIYQGAEDNTLDQNGPGNNHGRSTSGNLVGVRQDNGHRYRTVMRFNLGDLTKDIEVTGDAILRVQTIDHLQYSDTLTAEVYRLLPGSGVWTEAGSTWNHQTRAKGEIVSWAGRNGAGEAGTDYAPTPLDSARKRVGTKDALTFTIPGELVQSWIDQPAENCGLIFKEREEKDIGHWDVIQVYFSDSEHAPHARPSLEFHYKVRP